MSLANPHRVGRRSGRWATYSHAWPCLIWISLLSIAIGCGSSSRGPRSASQASSATTGTINVADFGATGDGATDDSAAFQAALAALDQHGGGTLTIPAGRFVVGDVSVPSGIAILGAGDTSVLAFLPGAQMLIRVEPRVNSAGSLEYPHDVSFASLALEGRSLADGFLPAEHLLRAIAVTRFTVENVTFRAFQGDGLYVGTNGKNDPNYHNHDVVVRNNVFDGVNGQNRNGISIIDCQHCTVEQNTLTRLSRSEMPGAIDVEPNHAYETVQDITIRDNTVENCTGSVGALSIVLNNQGPTGPAALAVEHNIVRNSTAGLTVLWATGLGAPQGSTAQIAVRDNRVEQTGNPLRLDGAAGVEVSGNTLQTSNDAVILGDRYGASNVLFRSNQFMSLGQSSGRAIQVGGTVSSVSFDNNEFVDAGRPGATTGTTVYFGSGTSTSISFTGNTFRSPNFVTHLATDIDPAAVFDPATNTWQNNTLLDGIVPGTFAGMIK